MKFTALNIDSDRLSLDFLGLWKPAHKGIKERYPRKSRYFTAVGRLQITMGMLPITTNTTNFLVVSTSMTLKNPELPK